VFDELLYGPVKWEGSADALIAVYRKAREDLNDLIMRNVTSVYLQP
jgi:hypothetical protein